MLLQENVSKESQESGEDELPLMTWQKFALKKIVVLQCVIEEMTENEGKLPHQLFDVANRISMISSCIKSLEKHEEDFERLLGNASGLVIVFWKKYNKSKSRSLWPPPKFQKPIKELVQKCEKNPAKRILVGCFGIRDLGSFKEYQERLDSVASFLEGRPNNIELLEVLREVVDGQAQPQDEDTELSEEPAEGNSRVKKDQEPIFRLGKVEKLAAAKPVNHKVKSEDDEEGNRRGSKALGKQRAKTVEQNKVEDGSEDERVEERSVAQPRLKGTKGTKKARATTFSEGTLERDDPGKRTDRYKVDDGPVDERVEERSVAQPRLKGTKGPKMVRATTFSEGTLERDDPGKRADRYLKARDEEDVEEETFGHDPPINTAAQQLKAMQNPNKAYEGEAKRADIPIGHPAAENRLSKGKKPITAPKRKVRSQTAPVRPRSMISGFSFTNTGGFMVNENIGNTGDENTSDVDDKWLGSGSLLNDFKRR
ncbi:hypothetical protein BYT27DRAFT_7212972 [Phlegmacium glaucopus]|nr:hypothetical protein BYT27DRAFT_7212972 [Phlegmacium glaucopus]